MSGWAGFDEDLLTRIDEIVAGAVARGDAPGVVAALARGDAVHVATAGVMAVGGPPMRRDTLFRIASITKPMTAAVVLSLADEGLLDLDEMHRSQASASDVGAAPRLVRSAAQYSHVLKRIRATAEAACVPGRVRRGT